MCKEYKQIALCKYIGHHYILMTHYLSSGRKVKLLTCVYCKKLKGSETKGVHYA